MTVAELRHALSLLPDHEQDYEIGFYDEWGFQLVRELQVRGARQDKRMRGTVSMSELTPDDDTYPITHDSPEGPA